VQRKHEQSNVEADTPIRAITLLACAAFASMASQRVCDPLLPQLAQSFGISNGQAAQTITAFAVAYGVLQIVYGPLGDRYGKYRVVAAATLACTLGSIGAAVAGSLGWLILCRVLGGATAAAIIPLSMAWIGDTIPYERRQATLARFLTGTTLGLVSGQLIGGIFADTLGWRWAFVLLAVIYAVVGVLLNLELRRLRGVSRHSSSTAAQVKVSSLAQIVTVLRLPWAKVIIVTVFLENVAALGALAFVPSYLHTRFGLPLTLAGAILATYGLGGLAYTFLAKRLVVKLGERGLAQGGGLVIGAAFAVLWLAPSWSWALPASFLAGLGFYMLHNTLQTNATQMAPQARGTAVALFAIANFIGQSVGVAGAAMLVDAGSASLPFVLAAIALPLIGFGFARALRHRPSTRVTTT
jgi:predicted MFS family arabinose efflux permease